MQPSLTSPSRLTSRRAVRHHRPNIVVALVSNAINVLQFITQPPDFQPPPPAPTANMAPSRTRNTDSDGPSTADASANEDVEMQDQSDRVNGFKKFGVSPLLRPRHGVCERDVRTCGGIF